MVQLRYRQRNLGEIFFAREANSLMEAWMKEVDVLNQAFATWLEQAYHNRVHRGDPPLSLCQGDPLYPSGPRTWKSILGTRREGGWRKTVVFQNRLYEAPLSLGSPCSITRRIPIASRSTTRERALGI